jgi:2-hydroxychromene-2-carboxylate isomerase
VAGIEWSSSVHRHSLDFWYDFASPYSYLAAMRIEALAEAAAVDVRWRPFLLGPIFATQGWTDSPLNIYPVKGRYLWRDLVRQAARLDLPLQRPTPFPQNSLTAARIALALRDAGQIALFSRGVFSASFGEGRSISEPESLAAILRSIDLDPGRVLTQAQNPDMKGRLRAETEEARSRGLFGAPSFLTSDGELFWGNDRLEEAIAWAAGDRPGALR